MESFSQNSNKLDFQHEARILNGIWLITALGLVATAGLAWGAKYLEIRQQNMIHRKCILL